LSMGKLTSGIKHLVVFMESWYSKEDADLCLPFAH
jgi:hypothetical protein